MWAFLKGLLMVSGSFGVIYAPLQMHANFQEKAYSAIHTGWNGTAPSGQGEWNQTASGSGQTTITLPPAKGTTPPSTTGQSPSQGAVVIRGTVTSVSNHQCVVTTGNKAMTFTLSSSTHYTQTYGPIQAIDNGLDFTKLLFPGDNVMIVSKGNQALQLVNHGKVEGAMQPLGQMNVTGSSQSSMQSVQSFGFGGH